MEEGEREQRPRGLCDVSNTCNWWRRFDCFLKVIQHLGGSGREGEDLDHGIEHHHDPVSSQANTSHLLGFSSMTTLLIAAQV